MPNNENAYSNWETVAREARATYWDSLGDGRRADAEPSHDSLAAWVDALQSVANSIPR